MTPRATARRQRGMNGKPIERLKQVPMFLPPGLEGVLRLLPAAASARAERLRARLVSDDRTWLHVVAEAAGVRVGDVLARVHGPHTAHRARDRAWWTLCALTSCDCRELGQVWGAHPTTIRRGVERHQARLAAAPAALAQLDEAEAPRHADVRGDAEDKAA